MSEGSNSTDNPVTLVAHVHMQRKYTESAIEYVRPDEDLPGRQVDIPKLRQGGVNCVWLSEGGVGEILIDSSARERGILGPNRYPVNRTVYAGASQVHRLIRGWDAVRRLCRDHSDSLELATTVCEARAAIRRGKIAIFMHTEALLIANDLAALRAYHAMGLRVSGLAHASPLDWADTSVEQSDPSGLTEFGVAVVREMNALGIVIDVSHASDASLGQVLKESRHPVVASHSLARALSPASRNLSDEAIKGIAEGGGVIGIHCSSGIVDATCYGRRRNVAGQQVTSPRYEMIGRIETPGGVEPFRVEAETRASAKEPAGAYYPTVALDRLVDHVDYLVSLVGHDHVRVGTDLNGLEDPVEGFGSVAEVPNFSAALRSRDYSPDAIRKIMGENFFRVMETVIGE